jgi:hypothetical protein
MPTPSVAWLLHQLLTLDVQLYWADHQRLRLPWQGLLCRCVCFDCLLVGLPATSAVLALLIKFFGLALTDMP